MPKFRVTITETTQKTQVFDVDADDEQGAHEAGNEASCAYDWAAHDADECYDTEESIEQLPQLCRVCKGAFVEHEALPTHVGPPDVAAALDADHTPQPESSPEFKRGHPYRMTAEDEKRIAWAEEAELIAVLDGNECGRNGMETVEELRRSVREELCLGEIDPATLPEWQ